MCNGHYALHIHHMPRRSSSAAENFKKGSDQHSDSSLLALSCACGRTGAPHCFLVAAAFIALVWMVEARERSLATRALMRRICLAILSILPS